jgi:hypothetical protein
MSNPFTSSATRFRTSLSVALVGSVLIVAAIVWYGVGRLNDYADQVNEAVMAAANSEGRLASVQAEVQKLEEHKDAVERAKRIAAESKEYQYQDTIIADIEEFARKAGVNVQSYDFSSSSDSSSGQSQPTPAPADGGMPNPGGGEGGDPMMPAGEAAPAPSNLRSTVVNVTIESPVNYRNFLTFLRYIEQNLTRMQIASVSLSSGDSASQVSTESLQIEVYIR